MKIAPVVFEGAPLVPSKIVCVGRNYVEHIAELHNEIPTTMVVFNKPPSAISDGLHYFSESTRFEGELSFIVQNGDIVGVGFGFDLTKADIQKELKQKGLPWERAKSFDGSAVFSPFVPFSGETDALHFEVYQNGVLVQQGSERQMIHKPREIMAEVTRFMHLEDNDIIMSGTPKGVGTYSINDCFSVNVYDNTTLLIEFETIVQA